MAFIMAFALVFIALLLAFLAAIVYNIVAFFTFDRDLLGFSRRDCVRCHAVLGILSRWLSSRSSCCKVSCSAAFFVCMVWLSWGSVGALLDITSFVGPITTLILGVSYKDITTLILEVSYNDIPTFNLGVSYNNDYYWGTPCWLVALLVAWYFLCLTPK